MILLIILIFNNIQLDIGEVDSIFLITRASGDISRQTCWESLAFSYAPVRVPTDDPLFAIKTRKWPEAPFEAFAGRADGQVERSENGENTQLFRERARACLLAGWHTGRDLFVERRTSLLICRRELVSSGRRRRVVICGEHMHHPDRRHVAVRNEALVPAYAKRLAIARRRRRR